MELQEVYGEIQALGAEVIAISVDDADDATGIVEQHNLEFPVLYDNDFTVSLAWGTFNLLDDGVSAPATYVFDSAGDLVAYKIGGSIIERPSAQEVVDLLTEAG